MRVCSVQLANVGNDINDLSKVIDQRRGVVTSAKKIERNLQNLDQAIGLIKIGNNVVNVVPNTNNWNRFIDIGSKALQTTSGVFPEQTAGRMWAEVGSRLLDPNINRAALREGTYLLKETAKTYGDIAKTQIGTYTTQLALRTRQYYDLQMEQGKCLAQAINQKVDFSKAEIPYLNPSSKPVVSRGPIPEYSIPHKSPLTQFNTLPGAIGNEISPIGKTPLVVITGNTDPYRLGTMIRGFEGRGVQVLPAPANMNAQSFAHMVGADRVVKITQESGSASWIPSTSMSGPKPGGVTTDMSNSHVDLGNWPVMTTFSLFYEADLKKN